MFAIRGSDAEALPEGGARQMSSRTIVYEGTGLTVPMYTEPQPGWPCTPQTWASILGGERRVVINPPSGSSGGGGGGFHFPERSIVNRCFYTNGSRVPNC